MPFALGDRAPFFKAVSTVNSNFHFDTVAGRYVVLSFFGSTKHPFSNAFLEAIVRKGERFDVTNAIFFGVTNDPEDRQRIVHQHPARIYFFDEAFAIARAYGLIDEPETNSLADEAADGQSSRLTATTLVLDQALRVVGIFPMNGDPLAKVDAILAFLDTLPPLRSLDLIAPVLIVPHVFEPAFCKALIQHYEAKGGEDSGFMRDVNGKTTGLIDHAHKRRMDREITDHSLIDSAHFRFRRRLLPAIEQAYQFNVTRVERSIVACYDAAQGAHFKAHRDNTTLGTAHRRFAVTLNLNSPEYEGGEIWFPEFGPKLFKAPTGAAIVFSCSLLHEVPPVTRGKRYAFLPFLYDEAAAEIRDRNRAHLGDLSGASGRRELPAKPAECNATPTAGPNTELPRGVELSVGAGNALPLLDGTCGCGNPNGCGTCLSAASYPLRMPSS